MILSLEEIAGATGAAKIYAEKFMPYVQQTCNAYSIDSPVRLLCFLSQVGHESGGLYYTEELASGAAYEDRSDLGNTQAGDGVKYKGRGLIQITGRNNYKTIGDALGVDFINHPTFLGGRNVTLCSPDQLKYAALSAGWYWNSRKLNAIADLIDVHQEIDTGKNLDNFKLITRKINGGYNGLADRLSRYKKGQTYFDAGTS